jgi:hypothetical protein
MARFALYPNTVQISQLPLAPLGGQEFALASPKVRGMLPREIRGINSFNPTVLPSIVSQVPFKARQVR